MSSVNRAILLGNVGKDPEIVNTQNGAKIAKFSLATTRKQKEEKVTQWHNVICFNKLAEIVEKYVKKGDQLFLEGEIQYREYEKDGQKKYFTEILSNEIQMIGGKKSESSPESDFSTPAGKIEFKKPNLNEDMDQLPF